MGTDTIVWLAVLVVFIVVEAATTALVSVWFAAGALAALAVSCLTDAWGIQFLVFAVVSAAALALLLPRLTARRRAAPVTNGAALSIGKQGTVLRAIRPGELGRVHVDGLDWQARSETPLPEGARCRVRDAQGAVLLVEAVPESVTV